MKTMWKGSIVFGLVNIPIQLFTATESNAFGFTLLHEKCLTPLKYHRWCTSCDREVMWDETVKGIKKSDGSYLAFTPDDLKKLHPKKTDTIQIIEFVDHEQVPVTYFNHHYYVTPASKNDTAYLLFVRALENLHKAAIGRFVLRNKEYTCLIQPRENYLVLTTLYYAYELRGLKDLGLPVAKKLNAKELELAEELVEKLTVKKFDITQYKDTFVQEIKSMLKQKKKGSTKARRKPSMRKMSLITSLNESLKHVPTRAETRVAKRR